MCNGRIEIRVPSPQTVSGSTNWISIKSNMFKNKFSRKCMAAEWLAVKAKKIAKQEVTGSNPTRANI